MRLMAKGIDQIENYSYDVLAKKYLTVLNNI